jgi:predicted acylesterase/phospholipase RssA
LKNSNVLSLQGGGVLGLGQVDILMALEQKSGLCSDIFGLIGGTSVGSIIGACLSVGIPASQVRSFFTVEAPKIFKHDWVDDLESLVHPKYGSIQIEESLQNVLGDRTLADCKTKFIATAYDFTSDRPVYFKSYEKSSQDKNFIVVGYDSGISLWQVCRAASAAQTYFPAFKWNSMTLMDGGNTGENAPDLLATVEALQFVPQASIKMLSLGSGDSKWSVNPESMVSPSAIRAGLETIKILFSAGEDAQIYKTKRLLGNQHYRISPDLGNGQDIDDASDSSLAKLDAAAADAIKCNQASLDEFYIHSQPVVNQ